MYRPNVRDDVAEAALPGHTCHTCNHCCYRITDADTSSVAMETSSVISRSSFVDSMIESAVRLMRRLRTGNLCRSYELISESLISTK